MQEFDLAPTTEIYANFNMVMPLTQGCFVGWSINFAKKMAEAAISEGG
jgi:hypothetical protein